MIEIELEKDCLVLNYSPQYPSWVHKNFSQNRSIPIAHTFFFEKDDCINNLIPSQTTFDENDEFQFLLAKLDGDYFKIKARILSTKNDVLIHKDVTVNKSFFIASRNISIFSRIDEISSEPIIIGGAHENSIPINDYKTLIRNFPSSTQLRLYVSAIISRVLREYMESMTDAEKKLNEYLKRRSSINFSRSLPSKFPKLYKFEIEKYTFIRDEIKDMLNNSAAYSENEWVDKILEFILLIFPKYIHPLKEVKIIDLYNKKKRRIDIALIDVNGNLDIIEIKLPSARLLSKGKYRDNFTPMQDLSGTIMQAEKYLFHLSKCGIDGETQINRNYEKELPEKTIIKITNPKAIIIIGRTKDLTEEKKFDFEILRRKYANMIDIISYDDLLERLENTIKKFEKLEVKCE